LPNEVIERVFYYLPIEGKLDLKATRKHFYSIATSRIICYVHTLYLCKIGSKIHISFSIDDNESSRRHFPNLFKKAGKFWTRKLGKSVEYFLLFDCSDATLSEFSLFHGANIKNLIIRKELPLYFEEDNIKCLTALLSECLIANVSLVFDASTLKNLRTFGARCFANSFTLTPFLHTEKN
ncbi:hypothetical protein PFISCL1PPCAC_21656, partial [Pristionchus fissidentatus]